MHQLTDIFIITASYSAMIAALLSFCLIKVFSMLYFGVREVGVHIIFFGIKLKALIYRSVKALKSSQLCWSWFLELFSRFSWFFTAECSTLFYWCFLFRALLLCISFGVNIRRVKSKLFPSFLGQPAKILTDLPDSPHQLYTISLV